MIVYSYKSPLNVQVYLSFPFANDLLSFETLLILWPYHQIVVEYHCICFR